MPSSQVGYLEKAGLPRGVLFYHLDGPFISKVARANGQPLRLPRPLGHGTRPMGLHDEVPNGQRQPARRHPLRPPIAGM